MFCIHLFRSNFFSALAAGILWKLNPGLFLREFVQPNAAQVATMMTLWKMTIVFRSSSWNLLSLHDVIFYSPNSSNIHGECDFASSVSGNQLRKYTFFCVFLKKIYIANGRKIKVNSTKKYVKFLSGGYFFCRTFLI